MKTEKEIRAIAETIMDAIQEQADDNFTVGLVLNHLGVIYATTVSLQS